MKQTFFMVHDMARQRAIHAVKTAPDGYGVTVSEPTRTLEQNAAQWPILDAIAKHKQLCINGEMVWATPEDWKDVLTAVHKADMRVAMFKGRMILLGQRTSKFSKSTFSDWLEFLNAMAVELGINAETGEILEAA